MKTMKPGRMFAHRTLLLSKHFSNILNAPLLIQHTVKYIHWRAEDMILSYTYICKSCYKYIHVYCNN